MADPLRPSPAPDAAAQADAEAQYGSARAYVAMVVRTVPRKAAITLGMMLALSLTEWVGLVLLVPMLALAGLDVGDGMVGSISESVAGVLGRFGLTPSLLTVLLLYVAVVSLRAFAQRRLTMASVDLERSFLLYLRKRMYSAVIRSRWIYFSRARSSDFQHAIMGQCASISYATNVLMMFVSSALIGMIYLGLALKLSPVMSLLAVSSGLLLVFLLRKGAVRARGFGDDMTRSNSRLIGALMEHLAGMKTVKSCGAEDRNIDRFGVLAERAVEAYRNSTRNSATVKLWFEIASTTALCMLLYIAIAVMQHSTAEILLLLYLFARLVPRFSGLQQLYQAFVTHMPAFGIAMAHMQRCEAAAEPLQPSTTPAPALADSIRFEDVSFRYATDSAAQTLASINVSIPARRTTAIVGPSGAGKSTFADLLMGLLTPDSGRILVDHVELDGVIMKAWRDRIGYVPQDTFLFHDTVRGNLLWACPDATDAELLDALELAAARRFVERLPSGLDTIIGDRGVLLSGGERQRLALARALLRKPALLLLDEATSSLDSENELQIQRAIEQLHGRMTIVVITHRLSTIRRADMIHVVDGGRLVQSGNWDSLVRRPGRFRSLCEAQGIDVDVMGVRLPVAAG
jgi:ATP-binding cassette, subfamily C, bacterial